MRPIGRILICPIILCYNNRMSHQGNVWDREYLTPKLVTKDNKPQADTLRFFKYLKKEQKYILHFLELYLSPTDTFLGPFRLKSLKTLHLK